MRLKRIKLAGFKSFVDPTVIPFQSNLTAIVGPNGCGKSNVIDAIRWVLGETSARELRGELMSDVIFNGSASRQPVSQAAIEMVFDNSAGLLGGEYAQYNEIAIRREVVREDSSNYYLNGIGCRRKDIVDIFLGTGLGIHNYAIIEQGTIAKIIEAKPNELRLRLEEAAGISKYKERRRETENSLARVKENLVRINDIKLEVDAQLKVLKRQANAAAIYKKLREEERLFKAHLQLCHWQVLNEEINHIQAIITQTENEVKDKIATAQTKEGLSLELQQQRNAVSDTLDLAQTKFYQLHTEISTFEQRVFYHKKRKEELLQALDHLQRDFQDALTHEENDAAQLQALTTELTTLQATQNELMALLSTAEQTLLQAEEVQADWQSKLDCANKNYSVIELQLQALENKRVHLNVTTTKDTQTLERLHEELKNCNIVHLEEEQCRLDKLHQEFVNRETELAATVGDLQRQITESDKLAAELSAKIKTVRAEVQELTNEKTVLMSLKNAATANDPKKHVVENLFKNNKLDFEKRLVNAIQVASGWERAVETVLSDHLTAFTVANWQDLESLSSAPQEITAGLHFIIGEDQTGTTKTTNNKPTIADKISGDLGLDNVWAHIYVTDDLTDALKMRTELEPYESIITKDGIWLSRFWIKFAALRNPKTSILEHEKRLRAINKILPNLEHELAELLHKQQQAETERQSLDLKYNDLQNKMRKLAANSAEHNSSVKVNLSQLDYVRVRITAIDTEIKQLTDALQNIQHETQALEGQKQQLEAEKNTRALEQDELLNAQNDARVQLEQARRQVQEHKENYNNAVMRSQLITNQITHLEKNMERLAKQKTAFHERKVALENDLTKITDEALELTPLLEQRLTEKMQAETELNQVKNELTGIEAQLAAGLKEYNILNATIKQVQDTIHNLNAKAGELKITGALHAGQIEELGFKVDELLAANDATLTTENLNAKIENIGRRLERLGPINLAAINEYDKQKARKDYLEAQSNDLLTALTTLENAIQKIDQETTAKFQETFNKVNANFSALFPKIFGGGKALLQLTADEAGVLITAEPPGKRNASIHLLSGGEKALTAIALVFAIFQINPAPFCALDEVDAPFDDENVGRFCRLLKEMAEQVQFIYISHNKVSMENAQQLLGVTMHEPGVSRIVSVDIAEAIEMAGK